MEKSKKKVGTKSPAKVVKPVEKKKDKNQLKATILGVAMMVAALGLGVGTYAYYQTTITGNVTGSITAWSFLVNNQATSFTADLGDLKPGVSGSITLNLSAEASGLGVNAVVSFSNKQNWPANLKLYSNEAKTAEIVVGTTTLSRTIAAGSSDAVTIWYNWPIGTSAEPAPTTSETASFDITVVGTQVPQA